MHRVVTEWWVALGGSVSDLMVTAVCLQRGVGQVEIYWPAIWDLLLALHALPMWPWANRFSAFPPSFICLVYLVSQEALKSRDCILLSVCAVPNITGPQASWSPKDAVAIQVVNVKEVLRIWPSSPPSPSVFLWEISSMKARSWVIRVVTVC